MSITLASLARVSRTAIVIVSVLWDPNLRGPRSGIAEKQLPILDASCAVGVGHTPRDARERV